MYSSAGTTKSSYVCYGSKDMAGFDIYKGNWNPVSPNSPKLKLIGSIISGLSTSIPNGLAYIYK